MKTFFLGLFAEKINEKKYFEYCVFIFTFELYDINNNSVFEALFNYLNNINLDECDTNQLKKLATKLLDFDKIYLSKNIEKLTKKEYSKFMRSLIQKTINEEINECFALYRKKLNSLKNEFEKNNSINISEESNNSKNNHKDNNENELFESKTDFIKESCNQKDNDEFIMNNNAINENKSQ
jgi:hypothetical protein